MLESFKGKQFSYTPLTKEEMSKRGILGRLVGPIADTKAPTRNGRTYSKELWENVFNDPLMQEKINNRCLFQELGHPEERTEVDLEKICACLAETPKVGEDGLLYGVFDILPTKNGQLLKVLCDYGTNIGISSRGTGDIIDNGDGEEVDPSTYDCETWDFVIIPAVEKARLSYVTEGLDKDAKNNMLNLKKALCEELEKANPEDRKVMEETLQTLKIDLEEPKDSTPLNEDMNKSTESTTPNVTVDETKEANSDGSDALIKSFQESLMKSAELEQKVKELQEQLAVSNTEVNKLKGENERHKSIIVNLTRQVRESKDSNKNIPTLEEELKVKENEIKSLTEEIKKLKESRLSTKQLRESISSRQGEIKKLNEQLNALKEESTSNLTKIQEELNLEKKNSKALQEEVTNTKKMIEGYKRLANNTIDKYIGLKAVMLNVKPEEIKNKLPSSYKLSDVDRVCESLQQMELNLGRLPFKVDKNVVVKVNESKQVVSGPQKVDIYDDDYVDERLLKLANGEK